VIASAVVSRRAFTGQALASLTVFALVEALASRELLAATGQSAVDAWWAELGALAGDLRGRRLRDVEFQAQLEALYRRVDLPGLCARIDLDELARRMALPARGAGSVGLADALPGEFGAARRVIACRAGRSIVPHGHADMCSGFLVLRGRWRGRHYDRLESRPDHHVIAPTIDRAFGPGDLSTVSDHRDNVHWFQAGDDAAFVFNVHVAGDDPRLRQRRLYLDPAGEPLPGGRIRAARMSERACVEKYG
jgi:hypothetical protein